MIAVAASPVTTGGRCVGSLGQPMLVNGDLQLSLTSSSPPPPSLSLSPYRCKHPPGPYALGLFIVAWFQSRCDIPQLGKVPMRQA